jgi:DNA sulfur modification protein DndB
MAAEDWSGRNMAEPLPGLAQGEELHSIYLMRSKNFDERLITAANKKSLQMKYDAEVLEGWSLLKKNKKSIRLKREKPEDRQLEDDVWCLFYRMGFKEQNIDRTFSIKVNASNARQLDNFAKDDEAVFIVECTHAKNAGPSL